MKDSESLVNLESQRVINVDEQEVEFFDKFLKDKEILWTKENRELRILPLNKSYTGYIKTPLRTIDLKPKFKEISVEHVIRLYNYVYSYQDKTDDELLDIQYSNRSIEETFLNNVREQLSIGILQEYKQVETKSDFLKGRVDYLRTYKNSKLFQIKPVHTTSFKLDLDLDINKLICGALTIISRSNKFSSNSVELLDYFQGVSPCLEKGSEKFSQIVFNSNTIRYKRVASEAAMIIDSLYFDDTKGASGGESFLINFDMLFELFVRKILLRETSDKYFTIWSGTKQYAEESVNKKIISSREYIPDILYKYEEENPIHGYVPSAQAVLDVKNKAYVTFKNADVYQISFYKQLLYSQCCILVYPSFVEKDSTVLNILNDNIEATEIFGVFVNISENSSTNFKKSIEKFIEKVFIILDSQGI